MKTLKNKFVADARARTGLLQKQFAPLIGTTTETLSQYETGKRQPSKRVLAQISNVLIERGLTGEPCSLIEGKLLYLYRHLSSDNQERLLDILLNLTQIQSATKKRKNNNA